MVNFIYMYTLKHGGLLPVLGLQGHISSFQICPWYSAVSSKMKESDMKICYFVVRVKKISGLDPKRNKSIGMDWREVTLFPGLLLPLIFPFHLAESRVNEGPKTERVSSDPWVTGRRWSDGGNEQGTDMSAPDSFHHSKFIPLRSIGDLVQLI